MASAVKIIAVIGVWLVGSYALVQVELHIRWPGTGADLMSLVIWIAMPILILGYEIRGLWRATKIVWRAQGTGVARQLLQRARAELKERPFYPQDDTGLQRRD